MLDCNNRSLMLEHFHRSGWKEAPSIQNIFELAEDYMKQSIKIQSKNKININVWDKIKDPVLIKQTILEVAKKKSKNKSSKKIKCKMTYNPDYYVYKILNILNNNVWKPVYHNIKIKENGKIRDVKIAKVFPDRVIISLLHKVLSPYFETLQSPYSYAGIKNKGLHKCVKHLNNIIQKKDMQFCLTLDIKKFFYSIDKNMLIKLINNKFIIDNNTFNLIYTSLKLQSGLPLGNSTSQMLANFYLIPLDLYCLYLKYFINKNIYLIRYCDNILIISKKYILKLIKTDILSCLQIDISFFNLIKFTKLNGLKVLGFTFYSTFTIINKHLFKKITNNKIHINQFKNMFFIKDKILICYNNLK